MCGYWWAVARLLFLGSPVLAQNAELSTPPDSLRLSGPAFGLAGLRNAVWVTGQNAAGLPDWQSAGYGMTTLGVTHTGGAFRRPQAPRQQTAYTLSSEGLRGVGSWLAYGEFSYQKTGDKQIGFSHGYDPFNGNPYMWADTLAGDWERDHIRARVALSSPRLGRWRLGLTLPYHVGQGARLLDPKPFYRVRELGVLPSAWYQHSARWGWGLVAGGQSTQEENEVGFYAIDNPLLYRLRGYGSFSRSPIVSAERLVGGTVWQGRLQTLYRPNASAGMSAHSWLGELGGQLRRETIREGIAAPQAGGAYTELTLNGLLAYARSALMGGNRVALGIDFRAGNGADPILRSVGATYRLASADVSIGQWHKTSRSFQRNGLIFRTESLDYQDKITLTDWSALRLTLHGETLHRWERPNGTGWFAGATAGGTWILNARFTALRPTRLTTILTHPDYQIQTTSAALVKATAGRDFRLKQTGNLLHRVELQVAGQFTLNAGNRLTGNITYCLLYL